MVGQRSLEPPVLVRIQARQYATMKEKLITIGKTHISYFDSETKGPLLLLLSGWTHQFHEEGLFIDALITKFHVVTISWPGYGDSDSSPMAMSMEYLAEIVHEIVNKLQQQEFILVGFSMGTQIATHYAKKYDANTPMILISAPLRAFGSEAPWYGKLLLQSKVAMKIVRRISPLRDALVKMAYGSIARVTENSSRKHVWNAKKVSMYGAYDTLIALLTSFSDPTLHPECVFIYGEHEVLQNNSGIPDENIIVVKGIGHGAFNKKPTALAAAVIQAIEKLHKKR